METKEIHVNIKETIVATPHGQTYLICRQKSPYLKAVDRYPIQTSQFEALWVKK